MKTVIRRFWIGSTAGFFFFLPYYSSLMNSWNRLEVTWTRSDAFAVAVLLVASGAIIALAVEMARRLVGAGPLRDRLMLIGLFVLIWSGVDSLTVAKTAIGKGVEDLLKIGAIAAFGYCAVRFPAPAKAAARAALGIVSPVVGIFLFQLFLFPAIPTVNGEIINVQAPSPNPPVFFFLFDEWSYGRAFENGRPLKTLGALAGIADQSVVFHMALAPGRATNESVPWILGEPRFAPGATHEKTYVVANSIFESAHAAGWTSAAVGCYLPYALWFGPVTDYSRQVPAYKFPETGFFNDIYCHANIGWFAALSHWNAALADRLYQPYARRVQRARVDAMTALTMTVLAASGDECFDYFHFSLPHDPFLDGGYDGNVRAVDDVLARIRKTLEAKNLWDKSLIVITSDHGWRKDPRLDAVQSLEEKDKLLRRVPLIVKLPGQKNHLDANAPYSTSDLKLFLRAVFAARGASIRFTDGQWQVGH